MNLLALFRGGKKKEETNLQTNNDELKEPKVEMPLEETEDEIPNEEQGVLDEEKKLVWKAINFSYHTYKRRGYNAEALKMEKLMKKYFADYKDVDEKFAGMYRPELTETNS